MGFNSGFKGLKNPQSRVILEKLAVAELFRIFSVFVRSEHLFPLSQQLMTDTKHKPGFSLYRHTKSFYNSFLDAFRKIAKSDC